MGLIDKIQDKLGSNKEHETTTGAGVSGQGSHLNQQTGTGATSNNPLSSNAGTHGSSGISGGSDPLVSGNNPNTASYGSGPGSHLAGSHQTTTGGTHTGSGLTGTSHSSTTGTSHSGSGFTGSSNTHNTGAVQDNRGFLDKTKDVLNPKRENHPDDPVTGTNFDQKNTQSVTGGTTHGTTHGTSSHHNTNAIPTAGGQRVGGIGEGPGYSSTHSGPGNTHQTTTGGSRGVEDHRGVMDKAKDTFSSHRTNQPDDPITGTNFDQNNRDKYTQGTQGSRLTGNSYGNQQSGLGGTTGGVGQSNFGSNTSSGLNQPGNTGAYSSTGGLNQSGNTGAYSSTTGTGYNTQPTIGQKLNPNVDADRDGKPGIMD